MLLVLHFDMKEGRKMSYTWSEVREVLIGIMRNATHYKSEVLNEACFLSAYQLAVLLYKNHREIVEYSPCPKNIGGEGDGFTSLANYIARLLSADINSGLSEVELQFFNMDGLHQFTFLDENGNEKKPSARQFSMFRYVGPN